MSTLPRIFDFSVTIASPGSSGVNLLDAVAQSLTPPTTKELLNASLNENYKNGMFSFDPASQPNNIGLKKANQLAYAFGVIEVRAGGGTPEIKTADTWIPQPSATVPVKTYRAFSRNVLIKNGTNVSVTGRLYVTAVS